MFQTIIILIALAGTGEADKYHFDGRVFSNNVGKIAKENTLGYSRRKLKDRKGKQGDSSGGGKASKNDQHVYYSFSKGKSKYIDVAMQPMIYVQAQAQPPLPAYQYNMNMLLPPPQSIYLPTPVPIPPLYEPYPSNTIGYIPPPQGMPVPFASPLPQNPPISTVSAMPTTMTPVYFPPMPMDYYYFPPMPIDTIMPPKPSSDTAMPVFLSPMSVVTMPPGSAWPMLPSPQGKFSPAPLLPNWTYQPSRKSDNMPSAPTDQAAPQNVDLLPIVETPMPTPKKVIMKPLSETFMPAPQNVIMKPSFVTFSYPPTLLFETSRPTPQNFTMKPLSETSMPTPQIDIKNETSAPSPQKATNVQPFIKTTSPFFTSYQQPSISQNTTTASTPDLVVPTPYNDSQPVTPFPSGTPADQNVSSGPSNSSLTDMPFPYESISQNSSSLTQETNLPVNLNKTAGSVGLSTRSQNNVYSIQYSDEVPPLDYPRPPRQWNMSQF